MVILQEAKKYSHHEEIFIACQKNNFLQGRSKRAQLLFMNTLLVPDNKGKRGGHNSYIQEKNLNSSTSTATENKDFSADNSFSGNLRREASSSGRSMT